MSVIHITIKLNHVKANIEGLELIRDRATLRTFKEKDWRELSSILELPEERAEEAIRRREKEDIRMRQDLQELLAGPISQGKPNNKFLYNYYDVTKQLYRTLLLEIILDLQYIWFRFL